MTGKTCIYSVLFLVGVLFMPLSSLQAINTTNASKQTFTESQQSFRSVKIVINNSSEAEIKALSTSKELEVYSILGKRIISIQLTDNEDKYYITLSKGMYVIRIGKSTQKIVIGG